MSTSDLYIYLYELTTQKSRKDNELRIPSVFFLWLELYVKFMYVHVMLFVLQLHGLVHCNESLHSQLDIEFVQQTGWIAPVK